MMSYGKNGSVLSRFGMSFGGWKCHMMHIGHMRPPKTRVSPMLPVNQSLKRNQPMNLFGSHVVGCSCVK